MRVFILTVLAILVMASPASAYEYPGQHPLNAQQSALYQEALTVARSFWTSRGLHTCSQDQLIVLAAPDLTDNDGVYAEARTLDCQTWILDTPTSILNAALRYQDFYGYADICLTAAHELGHSGGLPHSDDPHSVMAANPWAFADATPWDCRVWAKAKLRQRALQIRLQHWRPGHKRISRRTS